MKYFVVFVAATLVASLSCAQDNSIENMDKETKQDQALPDFLLDAIKVQPKAEEKPAAEAKDQSEEIPVEDHVNPLAFRKLELRVDVQDEQLAALERRLRALERRRILREDEDAADESKTEDVVAGDDDEQRNCCKGRCNVCGRRCCARCNEDNLDAEACPKNCCACCKCGPDCPCPEKKPEPQQEKPTPVQKPAAQPKAAAPAPAKAAAAPVQTTTRVYYSNPQPVYYYTSPSYRTYSTPYYYSNGGGCANGNCGTSYSRGFFGGGGCANGRCR